jgi:hypothetical protein
MEYFISHFGIIFIVACIIAAVAVAWWYLMERNAANIRQRAEARKNAAEGRKSGQDAGESGGDR